jgi:hypothetical protein
MVETLVVDDDKSIMASSMMDQFDWRILGVVSFQIVERYG